MHMSLYVHHHLLYYIKSPQKSIQAFFFLLLPKMCVRYGLWSPWSSLQNHVLHSVTFANTRRQIPFWLSRRQVHQYSFEVQLGGNICMKAIVPLVHPCTVRCWLRHPGKLVKKKMQLMPHIYVQLQQEAVTLILPSISSTTYLENFVAGLAFFHPLD